MDIEPDENQESSPSGDEAAQPQPEDIHENAAAPEPEEPQQDDALAEMRRALREEDTEKKAREAKGLRGFFQRLFSRRKRSEEELVEETSRLDELQFPEPPAGRMVKPPAADAPTVEEVAPPPESKPDFQTLVRSRLTDAFPEPEVREPTPDMQEGLVQEETPPTTPPGQSILTSLRDEPGAPEETPASMREAALEDYVAEPEPAPESSAPLTRDLRRSWRHMRPLEKRLLIGVLVFLGIAALAGIGFAVVPQILATPTPGPTPTPGLTPIPVSIKLPGDIVYPLSVGYVDDAGKWNPKGPEWLSGTEICRWVSLPWNEQREAIIRTFKGDDEIQLTMSNYQSVIYKVKSIEKVSDISQLKCGPGNDPVPGLLLMLSQEKTSDRWVVTSRP